jgi:hypothetical protein
MDEFVLKPPDSYKVKGGGDLPLEIADAPAYDVDE